MFTAGVKAIDISHYRMELCLQNRCYKTHVPLGTGHIYCACRAIVPKKFWSHESKFGFFLVTAQSCTRCLMSRSTTFRTALPLWRHINQNQMWCGNIGEYMFFGSIVGSEYCIFHISYAPPVIMVPYYEI